ncbi:MAG: vitamin B12-dependent ribonucleotide reductase [Nitrospinae bacterium]|nr:vitamin B12-dependent ribonucleotide reductase [Nitrospinota bacterium]
MSKDEFGIEFTQEADLKEVERDFSRDIPLEETPAPEKCLSENAMRVLEKRYLQKDDNGEVCETPSDMFRRVAGNIAQAEARYGGAEDVEWAAEAFYGIMGRLEFLPNSPTLMNAGRDLQQLSACFVLPVEDSMESIFEAVRDTALIHKSGGGTGFSFSKLRPKGSRVKSTSGVSSGPVSFMKVFDAATESVKQGGTRRGANMGILRVDHPDIMDFIDCKQDNKGFTNFNISVTLTDPFMRAVEEGKDYDLILPHTKRPSGRLNARSVFDKIVASAWKNGDPGIIFIDRINRDNPTPHVGDMESTNPCGEQPLLPYESCNLGSINMARMLSGGEIDWARLKRVTHLATRFLDDVIDMNQYPLEKIEKMTKANRKIGLGVMGWADMLISLGIPYNSERAITLAEEVMEFVNVESKKASMALASRRGAFPNYTGSAYDRPGAQKLRNATTTTIAPTGTISIIAGVSSGVEPLFALSFVRTVMDRDRLVEAHPMFGAVARERGFYTEELMENVAYSGHIEDMEAIPEDIRKVFVTAHGISPEWHLRTQAAFQRHTDNAVSKTVNFPNEAKIEDVAKVYMLAYHLGCKGVTIYRDGSREEQVLSTGSTYGKGKAEEEHPHQIEDKAAIRPRPDVVTGSTHRINTGCGSMYVTINKDETGRPLELFTQLGKAGGCAASQTESIGRLVSLALRAGVDVEVVRSQLSGISCHQPAWDKGVRISSCADAIGKAIGQWLELHKEEEERNETKGQGLKGAGGNGNGAKVIHISAKPAGPDPAAVAVGACPSCGGQLRHVEGCLLCGGCGYSKC